MIPNLTLRALPSTASCKSLRPLESGRPWMDRSLLRDMLLTRSVLDVRDWMAQRRIGLDMPLFSDSHSLLTFAIAFEPEAAEQLMQDPRVNINALDGHGELPLALAFRNRKLFDMLMAHPGIDINASDRNGNTALVEAAAQGQQEAAERLLQDWRLDSDAHGQVKRALGRARERRYEQLAKAIESKLAADSLAIAQRAGPDLNAWLEHAWGMLGAEPGFYYMDTEKKELVGVSDARELTVLYMRRLKSASAIESPETRELKQRAIEAAYRELLPRFTKKSR
jgi:hypothetical protein